MRKESRRRVNGPDLRKLREDDNLSIDAAAEALGCSHYTILMAERGLPTASLFFRMCDLFQVNPVDYLVSDKTKYLTIKP